MMVDGHRFSGIGIVNYDPRLEGERFAVSDNCIGMLAGEPWLDTIQKESGEVEIALSRVAIYTIIAPDDAVSNEEGDLREN